MSRTRWLLILDTLLLVLAVALQALRFTGLSLHEWLGLIIAPPLVLHLVVQWQWIVSTWRRATAQAARRARFNLILNGVLFVFMVVAIVSGVLASEVIFPRVGLAEGRKPLWSDLHSFAANTLVALVGLHLALNWRWIASAVRVHVIRRLSPGASAAARRGLTTEPEESP
ncbi:MAG TPA: DUF4405 domain-containing protein [Gemmatimonadales bacterium]